MAEAFTVGVATYNHGETIGPLLQAIEEGLAQALPGGDVVVIHADGGSQDDTVLRARRAIAPERLVQVTYPSDPLARAAGTAIIQPGALRVILDEARRRSAGCAIVDPGGWIGGVPPDRVAGLIRPVIAAGMDFAAPYYHRHPLDGTITGGIAFPLQRALYGKGIRFPLAVEFAGSARFVAAVVDGKGWPPPADLERYGAEAWIITRAVVGDFRICQVPLGAADLATDPVGGPGSAGAEVSAVLTRVLGALCLEMERHVTVWQKVRRAAPVPPCGDPGPAGAGEPRPVTVDVPRAVESFRLGERSLQEVWKLVLPPATLLELGKLAQRPDRHYRFGDTLWTRIIYDFALAHHLRVMNRDHLLAALVPLYLGWLASFVLEVEGAGGAADPGGLAPRAERRLEELCERYEAEKPYLIARWRWPDRFNP